MDEKEVFPPASIPERWYPKGWYFRAAKSGERQENPVQVRILNLRSN
jgi:hypothetical protein